MGIIGQVHPNCRALSPFFIIMTFTTVSLVIVATMVALL